MKVNQITAKGYAGEEEKHLYKLDVYKRQVQENPLTITTM